MTIRSSIRSPIRSPLYSPLVAAEEGGGAWITAYEQALGSSDSGYSGYNLRSTFSAALLANGPGEKIRITLHAGTAGIILDNAFIGHAAGAGDAFDFDGNQARVTFDTGSSGVTIGANAQKLSDEITFAYDGTKALVVAMHFSGASAIRYASLSGAGGFFKLAADDTSTTNASGYSDGGANIANVVAKIEVFVPT